MKRAVHVLRLYCMWALPLGASLAAEDASVERLLSKLPPPEKLIKPSVEKGPSEGVAAVADPRVAKRLQALFEEAVVAAAMGNYKSAISALERATKLQPDLAIAYYAMSDWALHIGRKNDSAAYARKAAALAPSNVYTWLQLAKAENSLDHYEAALTAMAKAAEFSPDSGQLQAVLGFSYINLNRIPQAIRPLQRAAKLLPEDYLVQSQLGYCLLTVGQTNAAIGHLRKGASLNSSYGPVWDHLGFAYRKQGDHNEAVKAFEHATRLMPSSPLPWQHLANEYRLLGRATDAERAAAHASTATPASRRPQKKG